MEYLRELQVLTEESFVFQGVILHLSPCIYIGYTRSYGNEENVAKFMFLCISCTWVFNRL